MYSILENYSLKPFNTFGFAVKAFKYAALSSTEDVMQFSQSDEFRLKPRLILGGGSNLLFTGDFKGIVIHPVLKGMEMVAEDDDSVYAKVYAGENWDDFVNCTVKKGLGGLENLSWIPGNAGASPVQNIGAYGVEVKDTLVKVEGLDLQTGGYIEMTNRDCEFGYRDSVFKRTLKDRILIIALTFRLSRKPEIVDSYGNVKEKLEKYPEKNISAMREVIINIRKNKLPDPHELGNAGSFFKNPVIDHSHFDLLRKEFPDIPGFPDNDSRVKIPAAWLIDRCGWKGFRKGDAGVHHTQSLVLVNYGGAAGKEIIALADMILESVNKNFNIKLELEVNVI